MTIDREDGKLTISVPIALSALIAVLGSLTGVAYFAGTQAAILSALTSDLSALKANYVELSKINQDIQQKLAVILSTAKYETSKNGRGN